MLGPLLLVCQQLPPEPLRLGEGRSRRPRPRDRERRRGEILHPQEHLRARADHPSHTEVQVIHVGAGIRRPESLVEGEGIPRHATVIPAGQDDLECVAFRDCLLRGPDRLHEPPLADLRLRRIGVQFRFGLRRLRQVLHAGAAVAEILRPPEDMIDDHAVQIEPELEFREGRVGVRGHRIEIANEFVRHVSNEAADISSRDARRVMFREDGPERRDRPVRLDCLAVRPQHAGAVRDDHLGIEAHEGPLRKPRRSGEALEDEGVRVVVPRGGEQRVGIEARIERDALHRAASSGIGRLLPNTTSAMRWAAAAGSGAWNT